MKSIVLPQKNYIPNDRDLLLVRHRTTGVTEQKIEVEHRRLHLFDVGGQKSERKKWIHCFEHVTAVLFVASLSSYNEVLFEDDSMNAMHDSISLFEEICNLRWFATTAMILFLNKSDLFAEKIQKYPLTVCFESYDEDNSFETGIAYIKLQFESKNQRPREKPIYSHITCATDKNQVQRVFHDVQHVVINNMLQQGGLL